MPSHYDIAIVGGGLVGASLAVALRGSGKSVVIIEPAKISYEIDSALPPGFDQRTIALTHSGQQIYAALGIWDDIAACKPQPIVDIHVSDRGHFGQTHLCAEQMGTAALGYVIPTAVMGEVLWKHIGNDSCISRLCPATVETIDNHQQSPALHVRCNDKTEIIETGMVVLADGGRSELAAQVGIRAQQTPYSQAAIIAIVQTDQPHLGRAYERFTADGPLALLPHTDLDEHGRKKHRYAVVWTTRAADVETRMAYSDEQYLQQLQHVFGDRAGIFTAVSSRNMYPLTRTQVSNPAIGRVVAVGNAAHTVHPVAGQGFNLGLRDIAFLAEKIHEFDTQSDDYQSLINDYVQSRKHDNRMVDLFTHGLIQIFTHPSRPLSMVRNTGLQLIEHCPPLKRFLLSRTMGLTQTQSKLACGIPLEVSHHEI